MNKKEIIDRLELSRERLQYDAERYLHNGNEFMEYGCNCEISGIDKGIHLIGQLTSGWIPVTEHMPEFDQECLVTTDSGEIFTSKFFGYGEECQGYREYPEGVWEVNQCELDVIAWQPLPEPYKEPTNANNQ